MTKYTVDEIDRMRRAVEQLGGSFGAEDRLRTYMANETTVAELEAAARVALDPIMARQREIARYAEDLQRNNLPPSSFGRDY